MGVLFTNNASTTLSAAISSTSATSISVASSSTFPAPGAGEYFYATIDDGTNNEIVKVTAVSGTTWTVVRASDNTTARTFSSGDTVQLRAAAALLTDIQQNIAAKSANQTVYNATTASSATTYDVGTNPQNENNAMVFLDGVMQHHDTFSFSGSTLTFDAAPSNGLKLEVIIDNLINLQSSNLTVDTFTATNGQTAFTLSDTPAAEDNLIVFIEGVFQNQDSYSISNNVLTMSAGVTTGRKVVIYVINPVNIGTPSDGTVTSAKLSGNITTPGTLTVGSYDVAFDSPTFVVDNSNSRVGLGTASPSVPVDIVGDVKMSSTLDLTSHLDMPDSANIKLGTGDDLLLYHDGTNSYIANTTGALKIATETSGIAVTIGHTTSETTVADNLTVTGTITGTLATAAQTNITSLGTLTTLTVDDITINGSTISDGGDLTVDVAGDFSLDADGGDIWFKDGGTAIGQFRHASSSFIIKSNVTDNDLILRGDDGGSAIDALTLDMSEAGKATFNSGVVTGGPLTLGDYIEKTSGNLTIDVAGDIILDADGGDFYVKDGGTTLLHLDQYYRLGLGGDAVAKLDIHYDSGGFDDSDASSRLASSMMHFQGDNDMRLIFTENGTTFRGMLGYEHAGSSYMGIWDSGSSSTPSLVSQGGKIGIGQTSPSADLHITGSGDTKIILEDGSDEQFITAHSGGLNYGVVSGDSHTFVVDTTDEVVINATGMGIGTSSPAGQLHVHGSGDGYLYITGDGNPLKGGRIIGHDGGLTFQPNTGSNSTYSEAMRITTDKHVGIGHTSPSTRLYVYNSGGGSSDCMTVQSGSTANSNVGMIIFRDNDGDYCGQITTNGSTNTAIYNANTSDERLKENITDWDIDALSLFKTIEPKEFNFKSQDEGAPKVRGYIAQTEASKFPEAFTTDASEEAYYSYNPSGMVIYLMKALKEQVAINEALEARITALESS